MTKLEAVVEKHLEQSGFIQSDLNWLKKSFWVLATAGVTFNTMLAIAFLNYFLKK